MITLFKQFKDSWKTILCVFLLLIVQAMCDLSLPDYTSKIINVGVQQGGIDRTSPEVIRKDQMDHLLLFLSNEEQEIVTSSYRELKKEEYTKKEWDKIKEKYPKVEQEVILKQKKRSQEEQKEVDDIIKKPLLLVSLLDGENEQSQEIKKQIISNLPSELVSQNVDLWTIFKMLPQEVIANIKEEIDDKIQEIPDMMIDQGAIAVIKNEYIEIGMKADELQTKYIMISGAKMLGVALLSMASTIAVGFLASKTAARTAKKLREKVFSKVLSYSDTEFKTFGVASLITRSTNDIQQIQMLSVMLLRIVCYAPIMGIGGVIKVLGTNTSMAWIIAVSVMAILSLVVVLFAVAMPKFRLLQKLMDKLNLVMRETLTGLPVIRAFSNQKHEEARFDKANRNLSKTILFVDRVMGGMMPLMMFVMNATTILIVWNASHGINDGIMQVGDLMAFIQYTMQIIMSFLMISMLSIMLPRASVSMKRIDEVLTTPLTIKEVDHPKTIENPKGEVEFHNVSFCYPDAKENILSNINFKARPGETTAFIGSTGSGKSTLINLIPRFYDVTEGEIRIDGVNIKELSLHDLHQMIGYVPQKGVLFKGTIASNIKYGDKKTTDQRMQKAAEIAQATPFIEEKENKYDAKISQGGTNVSGGQKQRLSIARAVAIAPKIYIFDDSFSALDFKTDAALRKALKKETKDSTVLIVAQRISTIMHAEQIIVLNEGKVAGIGTHEELMKNCSVYQEIALSQLSKEELDHEEK